MDANTHGERLAAIEAIVTRTEKKIDEDRARVDKLESRVSRLERYGAAISGACALVGFYVRDVWHKS